MQQSKSPQANPFVLMMSPAAVFEALARSDRQSAHPPGRICRPLDNVRPRSPAAEAMARCDAEVGKTAEPKRDAADADVDDAAH